MYLFLCVKTSVTFKILTIWCNTPIKAFFSTAQNSFWTRQFWCLLVLLPFFCFTSSTLGKMFPFEDFFHLGKQQKSHSKIGWIGRVGHKGHAISGQKLLSTQGGVGRCTGKPPSWKGKMCWVFKKIFTEAECSFSHHHQLVPWHRWVPRTLT